jgi:hypothetical protein
MTGDAPMAAKAAPQYSQRENFIPSLSLFSF